MNVLIELGHEHLNQSSSYVRTLYILPSILLPHESVTALCRMVNRNTPLMHRDLYNCRYFGAESHIFHFVLWGWNYTFWFCLQVKGLRRHCQLLSPTVTNYRPLIFFFLSIGRQVVLRGKRGAKKFAPQFSNILISDKQANLVVMERCWTSPMPRSIAICFRPLRVKYQKMQYIIFNPFTKLQR